MSSVTTEIIGRETVSKAALEARKGLSGLSSEANATSAVFTKATAVAAGVGAALFKLGQEAAACFKEFAEQEKSIAQFNAAMSQSKNITESGANALREYAQEISTLTGVDDDAILSMEAFLAASGRNEKQIRQLISAAADYSAATGKDLKGAVEELNKTFSGSEGRIGTLIPALKDLTDEELKAGRGVDVVAAQFEGFAGKMSNIADVKLKNLSNAWEDLRANLGKSISVAGNPMIVFVTELINKWNQAIDAQRAYGILKTQGDTPVKLAAAQTALKYEKETRIPGLEEALRKSGTVNQDLTPKKGQENNLTYRGLRAQLDTALKGVDQLNAQITDYKKVISLAPAAFDQASGMAELKKLLDSSFLFSSGGGETDDPVKKAKELYKAVEEIFASAEFWNKRNKVNPYSEDEASTFWEGIKQSLFDLDAMDLGPQASNLKNQIWKMWKEAVFVAPDMSGGDFSFSPMWDENTTPDSMATNALSASDQAWSDRYTGLAAAFEESKTPESLAVNAVSASDKAWAERYSGIAKQFLEFSISRQTRMGETYAEQPARKEAGYWDQEIGYFTPAIGTDAYTRDITDQAALEYVLPGPDMTEYAQYNTTGTVPEAYYGPGSLAEQEALDSSLAPLVDNIGAFHPMLYQILENIQLVPDYLPGISAQAEEMVLATHGMADTLERNLDWKDVIESTGIIGKRDEETGKVQGGTEIGNIFAGLSSMGETVWNAVKGIVGMVSSLSSFQAIMNPLQTIFSAMMDVLGPLIETILQPIVGILKIIGMTIGQMLAPILSALAPVIKLIGDAFVWLYNYAIRPFANFIITIGNFLFNAIAGAYNWINNLWGGSDIKLKESDDGYLKEITSTDLNAVGAYGSTGFTSGAAATYDKPRDIMVNVQVTTAALVGNDGISQFALIIGRELRSAGVLGMA